MDSFELNKVAGAVLGALLFAMGTGFLAELIYHPRPAGERGYALPEAQEASAGAEKKEPDKPLPVLLASADPAKGQNAAKKCGACHNFDKGGANKVGPDLWGVVGRNRGTHEGFNYSAGMKSKSEPWTYEEINQFITNPKGYVPGTIMAFAGDPSAEDRANILAYLRTLSDNPVPFPQPAAAAAGDKPAGEAAPDAGKADAGKAPAPEPAKEPEKK